MGVLRLSHNWLINKVVYVYIEYVRNVPVLLHILMVHGVIVNTLPRRKTAISIDDTRFLTNRGLLYPKPIFEPASCGRCLSPFSRRYRVFLWFSQLRQEGAGCDRQDLSGLLDRPGRRSSVSDPGVFSSGMPMTFEMAGTQGLQLQGRPGTAARVPGADAGAGAVYRGLHRRNRARRHPGDQPRPDRGRATRWVSSPGRTMRLVIIPQALRVIIPPLTSQYLNLTKNSSLAIAIGYMDIVGHDRRHHAEPDRARALEIMTIVHGGLPVLLAADLGVHELVQQEDETGGAIDMSEAREGKYAPGHPPGPAAPPSDGRRQWLGRRENLFSTRPTSS